MQKKLASRSFSFPKYEGAARKMMARGGSARDKQRCKIVYHCKMVLFEEKLPAVELQPIQRRYCETRRTTIDDETRKTKTPENWQGCSSAKSSAKAHNPEKKALLCRDSERSPCYRTAGSHRTVRIYEMEQEEDKDGSPRTRGIRHWPKAKDRRNEIPAKLRTARNL